ncbi:MAG: F0F1 ATP synthase subunit delta [Prevotella sp.]|nr:F0F1 ATP synthase subunit delta [Prevotella sp.]
MNIGVISVRYARALLKSALEQKIEELVCQDMQNLATSYLRLPQLRTTIDNPMLAKEDKKKLLLTACGKDHQPLTARFVDLVLGEDRENMILFMANSYVNFYRQQRNIICGRLITATAVTPETEQKMRQMVENRTNGTVEFETEVSPDILGGFILEYDTYRMDASVKTRLNRILKTLKNNNYVR